MTKPSINPSSSNSQPTEQERLALDNEHRTRESIIDRLRNPLVLGIIAGFIAAFGNAVVSFINGYQDQHLERTKAEYGLILEVLRTQDQSLAQENLRFIVNSNLISDQKIQEGLRQHLASWKPGTGPVLPNQWVD